MKGYKMVRDDYTAFYDKRTKYIVGKEKRVTKPDLPGVGACGRGLHISKEPHNPLRYNAQFPWRLLEVEYNKKDIICEDSDKIRVKKLKVTKELEPWQFGFKNDKRVYKIIERASKIKLKRRTKQAEKDIRILIKRHVALLNKRHKGKELIILKRVKFYSIKEWDSVWYSVMPHVV